MVSITFVYLRAWDTVDAQVKIEVGYYYANVLIETKLFEYSAPYPATSVIHQAAKDYCQTLYTARKDSVAKVNELKQYIGTAYTETVI